ncbi:MAG: hypothetical protein CMF46_00040 [Legionellales bacterium]|nr:hypothetical protein [Legionellales bacterium]|tara:strand:- start:455 stop:1102 length:648 start_codon:yes stop_codon:yes gene_type:complete
MTAAKPVDQFPNLVRLSCLALLALSIAFFYQHPHIDLTIAIYINETFRPTTTILTMASDIIYWLAWFFPIFLALYCLKYKRQDDIFILTCYLASIVVATNLIIKPIWGRMRPADVLLAKLEAYTSIFELSNHCTFNCSFVSGHAACGFFLISYAIIYPKKRAVITLLAIVSGLLIGLVRMLEGQHFLSDIVFSACINTIIIAHIAIQYQQFKLTT